MKELNANELENVSGGEPYSEKLHIRVRVLQRLYAELTEEEKREYDKLETQEEKEQFLILAGFEL